MDDSITVYTANGDIIFDSGNRTNPTVKKKTLKIKKNIEHELFNEMRKYNSDSFWDMFLLKASRDNFPKGFSFKDNILMYSMKSKYNFQISLTDDPEESFIILKKFVQDKGILSDIDKDNMKNEEDNLEDNEEKSIDSWKDLGKLQMNCMYTYINKLEDEYNLNESEKSNLKSVIKIGISSGYFNTKNIIVMNSKVEKICPLLWDSKNRKFSIDSDNIRIKKPKYSKVNILDLSTDNTTTCLDFVKKDSISNINKKWEKFLSQIYR